MVGGANMYNATTCLSEKKNLGRHCVSPSLVNLDRKMLQKHNIAFITVVMLMGSYGYIDIGFRGLLEMKGLCPL